MVKKYAIFVLIIAANILFYYWMDKGTSGTGSDVSDIFIVIPLSLPLLIVDLLVIHFLLIKRRSWGITKVTGYILFVGVALILAVFVIVVGSDLFLHF